MKRIKKILLLFIIILLSGCSVEYDLTINEDSSVNEKVVAKEVTNRMNSNTGVSGEQAINYLYEMFDREGLNTKLSSTTQGSTTIATVTGNHSTFDDYINNFTSDVFEEAKVERDGNLTTLIFDQSAYISSTSTRGLIYDDITINIKLPYKVIDHNADSYKNNIYTWEIKKDEDLRQIKIKYDESDLRSSKEFKFGNIEFNVKYSFMVVGIIILIAAAIAAFVYYKNKRNNKI